MGSSWRTGRFLRQATRPTGIITAIAGTSARRSGILEAGNARGDGGTRVTTLFLARHGQTEWHAENRYAGVSDIALDAEGRRQAEDLGRWAAGAAIEALWASPLGR
ncbi:histidine phosphatase family protein, partial [Actinomadura fibrosa]|uniref:histidine phosphatase family protein n=1 Tax=Actinomadura fibrosa TaxID=111802 RepID=UPI0013F151EF